MDGERYQPWCPAREGEGYSTVTIPPSPDGVSGASASTNMLTVLSPSQRGIQLPMGLPLVSPLSHHRLGSRHRRTA
jgi:hypothetical protein